MALSFLFGGDTNETPDSIRRKRDLVRALMGASNAPRNVGEGLNALGDGIVAGVLDRRADAAEKSGTDAANSLFNSIIGSPAATPGATGSAMPQVSASGNIAPVDLSGNDVYNGFIDTVKTGVTNPFGLAAVAATGRAESGFDPKNVNRTWSDPSASGQPGRAGGIMSWRGPRYAALSATGDLSPQGQAKFFLNENPQLIKDLNNAKSVEEAQNLMNRAWAFRGYDQPGGESARRLAYAQGFLPKFQQQGGGQQVASLDPSVGMPEMPQNVPVPTPAPTSPFIPKPMQGPMPFDNGRFGNAVPQATNQQDTASTQEPAMAPPLPAPTTIAPSPQVASVPEVKVAQAGPQQQMPQAPRLLDGIDPRIIQALNNPFLNPGQRAILQGMVEDNAARQRAAYEQQLKQSDPEYQLNLKKTQAELDKLNSPEYDFQVGRDGSIFRTDKRTGNIQQVYGGKADLPNDVQEYEYAVKQLRDRGTPADQIPDYSTWSASQRRAGASQVNIDQKAEGAFDTELAKKQAAAFDTMATEGLNARADIGVINELDSLLQGQGGTLTGLAGIAAKYGIGGEGVDDLQAAQALINKLVPTQRAPGSGSMSDRDVELFSRSLPSLWNAPGGNAKILNVMKGLAQYKQAQGEIADQVIMGEISRQEARRQLRELPNPLEEFRSQTGPQKGGRQPVVIDGYQIDEVPE